MLHFLVDQITLDWVLDSHVHACIASTLDSFSTLLHACTASITLDHAILEPRILPRDSARPSWSINSRPIKKILVAKIYRRKLLIQ